MNEMTTGTTQWSYIIPAFGERIDFTHKLIEELTSIAPGMVPKMELLMTFSEEPDEEILSILKEYGLE